MFGSTDPNRDLAIQQSIFGSRPKIKPTLRERLALLFRRNSKPVTAIENKSAGGPYGEIIRNALFSDIQELEPDIPIISSPSSQVDLPDRFIVISLCEDDPDAVQVELFMENKTDARFILLDITSRIERSKSPQVLEQGLKLKADRLVIHHPSLTSRNCVVARLKPGRQMHLML